MCAFAPAFSHQSLNHVNPFAPWEKWKNRNKNKKTRDVEKFAAISTALGMGNVRNRHNIWLYAAIASYLGIQVGHRVTATETAEEIERWLKSLRRPKRKPRGGKGVAVPLPDFPGPGPRTDRSRTPVPAIPRYRMDPEALPRPWVKEIMRRTPVRPDVGRRTEDTPDEESSVWRWFERRYGRGSILRYMRRNKNARF